jgi:hypothetical protein
LTIKEANNVPERGKFSEQISPCDELKRLLSLALDDDLPADLLSGGYRKTG